MQIAGNQMRIASQCRIRSSIIPASPLLRPKTADAPSLPVRIRDIAGDLYGTPTAIRCRDGFNALSERLLCARSVCPVTMI